MRNVPYPVMIITAGHKDGSDRAGMLVSSFNTLTLSPYPIITFNIKIPSSTYSAIQVANKFTVFAPKSVEQAKAYSMGPQAIADFYNNEQFIRGSRKRFPSRSAFRFHCQWLRDQSVCISDHMVMVGRVLSVVEKQQKDKKPSMLIYSNGQFRYPGEPLDS